MPARLSEAACTTVSSLAEECLQCFQCGQCIGACPSGFDLEQGPRKIVRLIRHPKPELWPHALSRLGLGLSTLITRGLQK